jgi:hypothetical protein
MGGGEKGRKQETVGSGLRLNTNSHTRNTLATTVVATDSTKLRWDLGLFSKSHLDDSDGQK